MSISREDIRGITAGNSMTFTVKHPKEINSVKTTAYQLNVEEPELQRRFRCKSDYKKCQVTITAHEI